MALDWNDQNEVLKRRQMAIQAGYKPQEVDAFIAKQKGLTNAASALSSGGLGLSDLPAEQRVDVVNLLQKQGKQVPKEQSPEDRKSKEKLETLTGNLDVLEKNYKQLEAKGRGSGDLALFVSGLTGGAAFGEVADYEALRKGLIGPVARALSGEVGVLTDRDIARAELILPKVTDDPVLARRKLANARELISKQGGPQRETTVSEEKRSGDWGLLNFLVPANLAQDIGAGIGARRDIQAMQAAGQRAQTFEEAALKAQDPQEKAQLLKQATEMRLSQKAPQNFSPDVEQNPLWRALTGATQIATTAQIATNLPKIVGGAKKLPSKANPFKVVGEMKKSAIEAGKDIKFSGDNIAKAGEEYIKHDPTAKRIAGQVLPSIKGKQIPLPELIKKLDVWNDAYTSAGRVGKSAEAGLYDVLAKAAKSQIAQSAPDVARANKLFGYLYKAPGMLQKSTWLAVKTAGLGKMLGL